MKNSGNFPTISSYKDKSQTGYVSVHWAWPAPPLAKDMLEVEWMVQACSEQLHFPHPGQNHFSPRLLSLEVRQQERICSEREQSLWRTPEPEALRAPAVWKPVCHIVCSGQVADDTGPRLPWELLILSRHTKSSLKVGLGLPHSVAAPGGQHIRELLFWGAGGWISFCLLMLKLFSHTCPSLSPSRSGMNAPCCSQS